MTQFADSFLNVFPLLILVMVFLSFSIFACSFFWGEQRGRGFVTAYCLHSLLLGYLLLLWVRLALLRLSLVLHSSRPNLWFLFLILVFLPPVWFEHSYSGEPCVCYLDLARIL